MSFFYVWIKVIVRGVPNLIEIFVDVILTLCIINVNFTKGFTMVDVVVGGVYRVVNSRDGNLERLGIRDGDLCILIGEIERRYSKFKGGRRWAYDGKWNIRHDHVEFVGVLV